MKALTGEEEQEEEQGREAAKDVALACTSTATLAASISPLLFGFFGFSVFLRFRLTTLSGSLPLSLNVSISQQVALWHMHDNDGQTEEQHLRILAPGCSICCGVVASDCARVAAGCLCDIYIIKTRVPT